MERKTKLIIGTAAAVAAITAGGIGVVAAGSGDDDGTEVPITGEAYDRATSAALARSARPERCSVRTPTRRSSTQDRSPRCGSRWPMSPG